jgi:hypothetical protein
MTLEVDPDQVRSAADGIGAAIVATDTMLGQFETDLASRGEPWGADDLGSLIGSVYQGALAMAMNCFDSNLDTMDAYASHLTAAADAIDATNQASADSFDAIGPAE